MTFVKAARARTPEDSETWKPSGPSPTLNAFDNAGEARATVISIPKMTGTVTTTWAKGAGSTQVEEGHVQPFAEGPRRLTPTECERLMGWPDGHTSLGGDGKAISDSQRYRMCGNGVVAPVAEYVARNLGRVLR